MTVRVEVKSKVILMSLLKIERKGTSIGAKDQRKGQLVELVGNQSQSPEAPPRSKIGGSKGDARRGAMEKSYHERVIEKNEVRGDDPIEYFLPMGSEVPFESQGR